nr:uncharacterized protein LOC113809515 isoform X2 [Penaeus vannamei]
MCIYTHVHTPRIPPLPCCTRNTCCCSCCAWTSSRGACFCRLPGRARSSASSSAPGTAAESRVCSLPPISGASADAADARLGTRNINALAARRRGSRASGPSSDRLGSSDALDELTDPDSPGGLRLLRRRSRQKPLSRRGSLALLQPAQQRRRRGGSASSSEGDSPSRASQRRRRKDLAAPPIRRRGNSLTRLNAGSNARRPSIPARKDVFNQVGFALHY